MFQFFLWKVLSTTIIPCIEGLSRSAVAEHTWQESHEIEWNDVEILDTAKDLQERNFKESLYIRMAPKSCLMNRDEGRELWKERATMLHPHCTAIRRLHPPAKWLFVDFVYLQYCPDDDCSIAVETVGIKCSLLEDNVWFVYQESLPANCSSNFYGTHSKADTVGTTTVCPKYGGISNSEMRKLSTRVSAFQSFWLYANICKCIWDQVKCPQYHRRLLFQGYL